MRFLLVFIVAAFAVEYVVPALVEKCPDGAEIYAWGVDDNDRKFVVAEHNRIRQMILDGTVPNQPRGKDILMITAFDESLSLEARKVSKKCIPNLDEAVDDRWDRVGQNVVVNYNSHNSSGPNWRGAIESWYEQHMFFTYPNISTSLTAQYTQLVWHNSNTLGCDFIHFYANDKPKTPYAKMYTCNYGPGGNYKDEAPYQLAEQVFRK